MKAIELLRKRDLCFKAAENCKGTQMWKIWVRKGNYLHNMAMSAMEETDYNTSPLPVRPLPRLFIG